MQVKHYLWNPNQLIPSVETSPAANQSACNESGHVETKTEPVSLKEEQADTVSTIAPTLPADESDILECLVYSVLEPSSYVFERNLKIELHKLTADEIAQWIKPPTKTCEANKGYRLRVRQSRASKTGISLCNRKVVNYRPMLTVSKKDANKHCSSRPKLSGPSSARIRANRLILKAKQFTTKPITKKYPDSKGTSPAATTTNPLETSPVETHTSATIAVHVEMYDWSTDEYDPPELPVLTCDATPTSVVPTNSVKPKWKQGKVSIKSYVLKKKNKQVCTAYCKLCEYSCAGVCALNEHHRSAHRVQFCPVCNKGFNTQTSLDKHSYVHGENKFVCDVCGKAFSFSSRLEQHKLTHKDVRLFCMKPTCGRFFKSMGDLNRHVNQHNAIVLCHCDFCTYSNVDKRNTESHMRTHVKGNEWYSCHLCGKKFQFSTQKLRHKRDGCNVSNVK